MKGTFIIVVCVALCHTGRSQVAVVPYAGLNSTSIYDGFFYKKGGAFIVTGVELEVAAKAKNRRPLFLSIAAGASYLRNGFYYSSSFAYTALDFYTQRITDMRMQSIQVPLTARINWQPFPLVEDWKVYLGLGATYNRLLASTLEEKYTLVFLNDDPLAPPTVTTYEDQGDMIGYGKKGSVFARLELGMKYKRIQLTWRVSRSVTDRYRTGLEESWGVPDEESWYISAYRDAGRILEKHSEILVGLRF